MKFFWFWYYFTDLNRWLKIWKCFVFFLKNFWDTLKNTKLCPLLSKVLKTCFSVSYFLLYHCNKKWNWLQVKLIQLMTSQTLIWGHFYILVLFYLGLEYNCIFLKQEHRFPQYDNLFHLKAQKRYYIFQTYKLILTISVPLCLWLKVGQVWA